RQARQGREITEHRGERGQTAPEVANRPRSADCGNELAPVGIDNHHRHHRESRPEEYDLPHRKCPAHMAYQHRHHGKQQRRDQFECDGPSDVHVVGLRLGNGPATEGKRAKYPSRPMAKRGRRCRRSEPSARGKSRKHAPLSSYNTWAAVSTIVARNTAHNSIATVCGPACPPRSRARASPASPAYPHA